MIIAAGVMVVLVLPVVLILVGRPPRPPGDAAASARDAPSATQIRARALRDVGFLSVTTAFALVLFAQVGFIVHLIAFLDPVIGRASATTAIALLTAMAVVGRVLFSTVIDRLNQRLASALSFMSQAAALLVLINFRNDYLLIAACAVFGFSVGNLITLPSLIVQREFRIQHLRRAGQPADRHCPDHLCLRSRRGRSAARPLRLLYAALLRLHRA